METAIAMTAVANQYSNRYPVYYGNGYYVAPAPRYAPPAGWYDRDGRWHAYLLIATEIEIAVVTMMTIAAEPRLTLCQISCAQ